ncbi:MAG: hypothetical protein CML91_05575 [Rhodobiaceae bacterium]|nr:hypothetical protein [Rhodobiaceae bacterium]
MINKNDQLDQVSEKIVEIKSRKKKIDNTQKQIRGKQISIAMRISIELIIAIIIGAILGWYIDKWLDTKPIFFYNFPHSRRCVRNKNRYRILEAIV